MQTLFENLESRRMFSAAPVADLPGGSLEMMPDTPEAPLYHQRTPSRKKRSRTPWIGTIGTNFFVKATSREREVAH